MVHAVICGKLTRNVKGLLGRVGFDPVEKGLVIAKLDSNDHKTQLQLHFRNKTELSILRDSLDAVLIKWESQSIEDVRRKEE